MDLETTVLHTEQEALLTQLAQSRSRVLALAQAGTLDQAKLRLLADTETNLALRLHPLPGDPDAPGEQLLAAYAFARPYLERLTQHDPAHIVVVDETHSYTPRKILRRVLDHALDHLNQIDQWLLWQRDGVVPTPTDGWATSGDTMPEDLQSLSSVELESWLWRIDLSIGMVAKRAGQLSAQQLDWQAPDGGWTLRYMLSHLAFTEIYYSIWLDEPLPEEATDRYREANARFERQLRQILASPLYKQALFLVDDTMITAEQMAQRVLAEERALLGM